MKNLSAFAQEMFLMGLASIFGVSTICGMFAGVGGYTTIAIALGTIGTAAFFSVILFAKYFRQQ